MNWFLLPLKKYAQFEGRSRRKEYWLWVLFIWLVMIVLSTLDAAMGTTTPGTYYGMLSGIFALLILIPNIAVGVRRLHDTDRTGWWLLIIFVPLIGAIWLLVLMVLDGTAGPNQYGEDPKGR